MSGPGAELTEAEREAAESFEALLAAHEVDLSGLYRDPDVPVGYWMSCRCGYRWVPDESGRVFHHRAHLAEVLARRAEGSRAAEDRAKVEAVERLIRKWGHDLSLPMYQSSRDRRMLAELTAVLTTAGGQGGRDGGDSA